MSFGKRVTEAREHKGLSREELAKVVGTSGPIIGRYEREENTPSIEVATKIANALEVSLDYLVGNASEMSKDPKTLRRLEDIANLSPNDQEHLFATIDAYIRDAKARKAYS